MATITESVEIKRPIPAVFAYTTDAATWAQWQSIIPRAEQTSPGAVAVGTTFKGTVRMMGLSMKWTARATEYQPFAKYGKNITSAAMLVEQHNTYAPTQDGTSFSIVYNLKIRGLFWLLSPVLVSRMRVELKKSLANLKGVLEAQN